MIFIKFNNILLIYFKAKQDIKKNQRNGFVATSHTKRVFRENDL